MQLSKPNLLNVVCPRYDMYSGESRVASMVTGDAHAHSDQLPAKGDNLPGIEPGPALEVIQLANGETIW